MGKLVNRLLWGIVFSASVLARAPIYAAPPISPLILERAVNHAVGTSADACVDAVGVSALEALRGSTAVGLAPAASVDNPLDFLRYKEAHISMGATVREYSHEFGTAVYHPLNEPLRDGSVPWVDPKAKAVVVFIHGSGTAKASGKNFQNLMNLLSNAGVAGISFDLPFHKEGPTDPRFYETDYFLRWLDRIISKAKSYGKPVHLVGHSYGPEVIQEYISIREYARKIKSVLLISPSGSYHPALSWTYAHITDPGYPFFLEDNVPNEKGGEWAGAVADHFQWMNRPPPECLVHVLLGETDEWWPGNTRLPALLGVQQIYTFDEPFQWFKAHYPNGHFVTIPGVGHYLFEAKAANGKNLLSELLFDMLKIPDNQRYVAAQPRSNRQRLATMYFHNPAFTNWIGARYPHAMRDEESAGNYLRGWETATRAAWRKVMEEIPTKYADFYQQRLDSWHRLIGFFGSEVEKAENRKGGWDWNNDMRTLMADFHRYLDLRAQGQPIQLGADPMTPAAPPIDPLVFNGDGKATRWGFQGPVGREAYERALQAFLDANAGRGRWLGTDSVQEHVAVVRYVLDGKEFTSLVLDGFSPEELSLVISEAFIDARRRAPGYGYPESATWFGTARGIRLRGKHKLGTVINAEPWLVGTDNVDDAATRP